MTSLHPAPPRHRHPVGPLRVAMIGARDLPVEGAGSSTAADEVARRLVQQGHDVTVLAPRSGDRPGPARRPGGVLAGTAAAAARLAVARHHDVAVVFGVAGAPLVPLLRARGTAVAVHVGGLEWQDDSTAPSARRYLRAAERAAVREADALIVGSRAAREYYEDEFGVQVDLIPFGTRVVRHVPGDLLEDLGLVPGMFHLLDTRFAPSQRLDVVVEGFRRSAAALPLVVVGAAEDPATEARVRRDAAGDDRIRLLGPVQDERLLDQLSAHALCALQGRSTGGAEPALLRAMGAGTAVVCWDGVFTREIAGTAGLYFTDAAGLASRIEEVERYPFRFRDIGELMQERARGRYDWDAVTECYEALAAKLARGYSVRGMADGRRSPSAWSALRA